MINFHGLFRNALRCRKTGACRILVPLRYHVFNYHFYSNISRRETTVVQGLPTARQHSMLVNSASCLETLNICTPSSLVGVRTSTLVTGACLGLYSSRSNTGSMKAAVLPGVSEKKWVRLSVKMTFRAWRNISGSLADLLHEANKVIYIIFHILSGILKYNFINLFLTSQSSFKNLNFIRYIPYLMI